MSASRPTVRYRVAGDPGWGSDGVVVSTIDDACLAVRARLERLARLPLLAQQYQLVTVEIVLMTDAQVEALPTS